MSEHLQPPLLPIAETTVDSAAFGLVGRLKSIADDLTYADYRREGLVYSFLERKTPQTSNLEYTADAVALLKNKFVDETQLAEFFSKSTIQGLRRGLLLLEKAADPDEVEEVYLDPMLSVREIIANELYERYQEDFLDKHYTGL